MDIGQIASAAEVLTRDGKYIVTVDASVFAPHEREYKNKEADVRIRTGYSTGAQDINMEVVDNIKAFHRGSQILYYDPFVKSANFYIEDTEFEKHIFPIAAKKMLEQM